MHAQASPSPAGQKPGRDTRHVAEGPPDGKEGEQVHRGGTRTNDPRLQPSPRMIHRRLPQPLSRLAFAILFALLVASAIARPDYRQRVQTERARLPALSVVGWTGS